MKTGKVGRRRKRKGPDEESIEQAHQRSIPRRSKAHREHIFQDVARVGPRDKRRRRGENPHETRIHTPIGYQELRRATGILPKSFDKRGRKSDRSISLAGRTEVQLHSEKQFFRTGNDDSFDECWTDAKEGGEPEQRPVEHI